MKKRIVCILLLGTMLLLCTGCYTAPTPTENQTESTTEDLPVIPGEIATYKVPEENLRVASMYELVPAFSVDGFYLITGNTFKVYDVTTKSSYVPCYQTGCKHTDKSCPAYFGRIMCFAEYKGVYYATIEIHDGEAYELVCRDVSGGDLRTLQRWESQLPEKEISATLRYISHDAAYVAVVTTYYAQDRDTGILEAAEETTALWKIDLETGEAAVVLENPDYSTLYGIWDGCAVFSKLRVDADAPEFSEFAELQDVPMDAWSLYTDLYYHYTIVERDLETGQERMIAEDVRETGDPNRSWGQYVIYKRGNTLCVYDMVTKEEAAVYTHENLQNYWLMDGRAFALVRDGELCRVFATELSTGVTIEIDNHGEPAMCFSIVGESSTVFRGNYQGVDCNILKEDFYRGNYERTFN